MSKKPKVVASYGDPRKAKRWAAKRIRRGLVKEIIIGLDFGTKPSAVVYFTKLESEVDFK